MPHGPVCGHSGCGPSCNVRYAGPTSHPRDHHIRMAAHGVNHVWLAAIVAGFAVVLTGSIAYTAANAETAPRVKNLNEAVAAIYKKLDRIERMTAAIHEATGAEDVAGQPQANQITKPPVANTCRSACEVNVRSCKEKAEGSHDAVESCLRTMNDCLRLCANATTSTEATH